MDTDSHATLTPSGGKSIAIVGFLCLSLGTLFAHLSPTRGYELSLYAATPIAVWVLLLISFTLAVIISFFTPPPIRRLGPVLATLVVVVIASLPVIRGYILFGQFDLLNHAGFVTEILNSGRILSPILYPAMHIEVASLSLIAGISGFHALTGLTGIFVGLFILGGTMLVRGFDKSWETEATGTLLLCLLLPIISIRLPKLQSIPAVFASFYCVFLLGLLTRLFQERSSTIRRITYIIVGPALVFYHPQFALIALGTAILLIISLRMFGNRFPYEPYLIRRAFGFSVLVGIVFWEWISKLPGFRGAFQKVVIGASEGGSEVPDPSGKLQEVGGSTTEIVLKVFGFKIVVSLFALGVGLFLLIRNWKVKREYSTPLYLIAAAGLVTLPLIVLFFSFLGRVSQGFRYIGFGFGLASIVAAVGIGILIQRSDAGTWARVATAAFLITGSVVVAPAVYKSPYVFQENGQVSEAQLVGYEYIFDHRGNGEITAIRSSPYRVRNALYGKTIGQRGIGRPSNADVVYQYEEQTVPATTLVPPHFSNRNFHVNNSNVYLISTARGRARYLEMYGGFRHNQSDFVYLNENSDRVYSNGDLRVYYFD